MPAGTHIIAQRRERAEGRRGDVGIAFGRIVDGRSQIADCGDTGSDAAIQPRATAQTADHRDVDGPDDCRTRDRTRMSEVEERRARLLQQLRLMHQSIGDRRRTLDAELRPHRNAGTSNGADNIERRCGDIDFHEIGAAPVLYGGMFAKGPKQSKVDSKVVNDSEWLKTFKNE